MLHKGQRVVCVNAKPTERDPRPTLLVEGQIYTIASAFDSFNGPGVLLEELANPYPKKIGWYAWRFRPAVERKTDISIFRRMLKTRKKLVDA